MVGRFQDCIVEVLKIHTHTHYIMKASEGGPEAAALSFQLGSI